jgi:hypothetical protein
MYESDTERQMAEYRKTIQDLQDREAAAKDLEDKAKDPATTKEGMMKGGAQMVQDMGQGKDKAQALGGGLTTMGMATANPWLVGGGLALSTAGAIKEGQNKRAQEQYQAEVQKLQDRQDAINRMAQIGQGLKV